MEEKKTSIMALLKVLEEESDENHILSQKELLNILEEYYGLRLDRRTLYRNIEMLQDFGYEISAYSENGKGYYLEERTFEPSEIYLLCNAVHASRYIPPTASKELIGKLLASQSKYYRQDYKNMVYVENRNKKDNKEFFLNIELIAEAIRKKKTISFIYTCYNAEKQLVSRREERYLYSPYYLISQNEKLYFIGKSKRHEGLTHFRVDRMKNVKITEEAYIRRNKEEDPYVYAQNKIYMYGGENTAIALKCDKEILDDVIDIFGKDIRIEEKNDHFIAYVKGTEEGVLYLALQYLQHMEVLQPETLREKILQVLEEGNNRYKK